MTVPATLRGPRSSVHASVTLPPSKSLTNRAFVAAAAAGGGEILEPLECDDTRLLARALHRAGWEVRWPGVLDGSGPDAGASRDHHGAATIGPRSIPGERVELDLGNSGTGSRFLLALLAAVEGRFVIDGSPRLRQRPMGPLIAALDTLGARIEAAPGDTLPARIDGSVLEGGTVSIDAGASSQFVSALMMMAPLTRRGLLIEIEGKLPSRPYLDLTAAVLNAFGGEVRPDSGGTRWRVAPRRLVPARYRVEGDWSAAAFFLAAAAVTGGSVTAGPLDPASAQGDRAMLGMLERAGARASWDGRRITLRGPLARPVEADLGATPDLFPALAVVAAAAPAGSHLSGLENLRYKESDRLEVMTENLRRLGAVIESDGRSVRVVRGMEAGRGGTAVTAAGDHRVAMAMAVAALGAGELLLDDAACVTKSFPGFWEEWRKVTG